MSALALLGAFGTLLGAGYGLLALLARKETQLSLTEQIAFSWLLGTGAISLLLWIFGLFVHGVLLPGLVSIICLSLGLVGWRRMVPRPLRRMPNLYEIFLGIIVFLEIAIVFYLSFVHTLGWDGLLNWEIKAHYAFANGGVIPATYFSDSGRAFSHPEYPLAIPFTELWLYLWLGEADQFWAKTIFPIFYVIGTFLLVGLGRRFTGKTWIGLLMAAFLFFVPQITVEVGSAIAGYADFPLGIFYLATIGCQIKDTQRKICVTSDCTPDFNRNLWDKKQKGGHEQPNPCFSGETSAQSDEQKCSDNIENWKNGFRPELVGFTEPKIKPQLSERNG